MFKNSKIPQIFELKYILFIDNNFIGIIKNNNVWKNKLSISIVHNERFSISPFFCNTGCLTWDQHFFIWRFWLDRSQNFQLWIWRYFDLEPLGGDFTLFYLTDWFGFNMLMCGLFVTLRKCCSRFNFLLMFWCFRRQTLSNS